MAEENDSTAVDAEAATTRKTSRLARIRRGAVDKPAGKTAPAASVARPAGRTPKASVRGPVRNIATLVIVGGLRSRGIRGSHEMDLPRQACDQRGNIGA